LHLQAKIVRQESTNIDANLERKKKQVEIEKKMCVELDLCYALALPPLLLPELTPLIHFFECLEHQRNLQPEQQGPSAAVGEARGAA
jgi:hypothetical protein